MIENKQRVHTVHQPEAEPSEKKKAFLHPHIPPLVPVSEVQSHMRALTHRRTFPSRRLQSSRVKNEHVTVQRIKTRRFREIFFFPRPSPRGSIQRVTHYIGGRAPLVTREGWRVFAVHTEHITSSGTASSVSSYKSEVLATGGP